MLWNVTERSSDAARPPPDPRHRQGWTRDPCARALPPRQGQPVVLRGGAPNACSGSGVRRAVRLAGCTRSPPAACDSRSKRCRSACARAAAPAPIGSGCRRRGFGKSCSLSTRLSSAIPLLAGQPFRRAPPAAEHGPPVVEAESLCNPFLDGGGCGPGFALLPQAETNIELCPTGGRAKRPRVSLPLPPRAGSRSRRSPQQQDPARRGRRRRAANFPPLCGADQQQLVLGHAVHLLAGLGEEAGALHRRLAHQHRRDSRHEAVLHKLRQPPTAPVRNWSRTRSPLR